MAISKKRLSYGNDPKSLLSEVIEAGDNSVSEIERLRTLLIKPEIQGLSELRRQLTHLQHQIQNPEKLIRLLLPVIAELLSRKVAESGEHLASVLAPIMDEAIRKKIQQDREAITKTLGPILLDALKDQIPSSERELVEILTPVISKALFHQLKESSWEIVTALAPVMEVKIKEQLNSQREEMVHTLYPVIGRATIKYLSEVLKHFIQGVNESLYNFFSIKRRSQKARSTLSEPDSTLADSGFTSAPSPYPLLIITFVLLSLLFVPWGIYWQKNKVDRYTEAKIAGALASVPELTLHPLTVKVYRDTFKLSGWVPNEYLRLRAEQVARAVAPTLKLKNMIRAVPADPLIAAAEVKRVASMVNEIEGVSISASYRDGSVTIEGVVLFPIEERLVKPFEQIPGIRSLQVNVRQGKPGLTTRIYFDPASARLKPSELDKISQVKEFMDQHPNWRLKIIGHTDLNGPMEGKRSLALGRAENVRKALIHYGIEADRLQVDGIPEPPSHQEADQSLNLGRCVRFEPIEPPEELVSGYQRK
ncbi:MAG TPA: OmpA family protein [Candidatus Limnocylindrales bacterium]|nr:OmpA family protein [Candidatus Limnocylindrales bacterium]